MLENRLPISNDKYEKLLCLANLANNEAMSSKCKRKQVGAVLATKDGFNPVAYGFGGAQSEEPCSECVRDKYTWHQDGCWSIHAELRAIFDFIAQFYDRSMMKAVNSGKFLEDYIMLTTHGPCDQCLKYMHMFGITDVIYLIPYHDDYAKWGGKITVWSFDQYVKEHFKDVTIP